MKEENKQTPEPIIGYEIFGAFKAKLGGYLKEWREVTKQEYDSWPDQKRTFIVNQHQIHGFWEAGEQLSNKPSIQKEENDVTSVQEDSSPVVSLPCAFCNSIEQWVFIKVYYSRFFENAEPIQKGYFLLKEDDKWRVYTDTNQPLDAWFTGVDDLYEGGYILPNKEQGVQVSDTTMPNSSNSAKSQNKPSIDCNSLRDKFIKECTYDTGMKLVYDSSPVHYFIDRYTDPQEVFDWFKNQLEEAGSLPLSSDAIDLKVIEDYRKKVELLLVMGASEGTMLGGLFFNKTDLGKVTLAIAENIYYHHFLMQLNQGDTASSQKETLREPVIRWVKERIKQLNEADAAFCDERWCDNIPLASSLKKQLARENSNKVTFARQELEEVLKRLEEQTPVETIVKGNEHEK